MNSNIERVSAALEAIRRGEIVVVTDDDDRENEGDLVLAAVHATGEKLAFIVRHTSGIVCAPLPREIARRLNLAPMVAENEEPMATAFTVTVDYRHGMTTGISAEERAQTVRSLANPNAGAEDFVRPGHIFPLIARDGGVLIRSGHTEAAVDLARLAGLSPVGVISELVNDDGTVMRGPQIAAFAKQHGLTLVSVADLIAYRQQRETLVERVEEVDVTTSYGPATAIAYRTPFDPMQHLALVFGDIGEGKGVPVRLHPESVVEDVFGLGQSLEAAMERIGTAGRGVVVYLREGSAGVARFSRRSRPPAEGGHGHEAHGSAMRREAEWREIGLGAQILKDLGISSIKLLAPRERRYVGLDGFGIVIEDTEILDG
jgi:3,4-dihydroxy 2-butanone 4-phosphate synthase/GTP cyclohydrolase II